MINAPPHVAVCLNRKRPMDSRKMKRTKDDTVDTPKNCAKQPKLAGDRILGKSLERRKLGIALTNAFCHAVGEIFRGLLIHFI